MAMQPSVENRQHMEVGVSGPDKANRMFITTGIARAGLTAYVDETKKENYSVHVEPPLTATQFRRAIATAALAEVEFFDYSGAQAGRVRWAIDDVDADYDDEEGKVELRFTLGTDVTGVVHAVLSNVSFTVTTLAKV